MRRKNREIFVSYQYNIGSDTSGFGNTYQFTTNRGHLSQEEVREMERILKEEQGFSGVVILNYKIN